MDRSAEAARMFNRISKAKQNVKQGSRIDFENIYEKYASPVYSFILSIHPHSAAAENVLERVFHQVWMGMHDFDQRRGSLFTWICAIARREALAEKTRCDLEAADSEPYPGHIRHLTDLKSLMNELAEPYRGVLLMSYFAGVADNEISSRLQLKDVKCIRNRGLAILSKLITLSMP